MHSAPRSECPLCCRKKGSQGGGAGGSGPFRTIANPVGDVGAPVTVRIALVGKTSSYSVVSAGVFAFDVKELPVHSGAMEMLTPPRRSRPGLARSLSPA